MHEEFYPKSHFQQFSVRFTMHAFMIKRTASAIKRDELASWKSASRKEIIGSSATVLVIVSTNFGFGL